MTKLNFRVILIHFIATWFFMFAFQTLLSLHEIKMIDIYRNADRANLLNEIVRKGFTPDDYITFKFWMNVGKTVGLAVAFFISLIICKKNKWSFLNSVIVLMLSYALAWTEFTGLNMMQNIYYLPVFKSIPIVTLLLIISLVFMLFGWLVFFHPKSTKFVDNFRKLG